MCGLVGASGRITVQHEKIFNNLLDVCQLRGRDSTGVISVNKKGEYTWVKQLGPPTHLKDSRKYQSMMRRDHSILIGHCRHKTKGDVSISNAHPFDIEEESICGVHNGTLNNERVLDGYHHSKVDSEVLYEHLALNGPEDTFSKTKGAWACVWWDGQANSLNFIRNDQRPLWFTWTKDKKVMFWASEPWMLNAVSRDTELWDGGKNGDVLFPLPVDNLWTFALQEGAKFNEPLFKFKPPVKIKPKIELVGNGHSNNSTSASSGGGYHKQGLRWSYKQNKLIPYDEWYREKNGGEVSSPFQIVENPKGSSTVNTKSTKESTSNSTKNWNKTSDQSVLLTATTNGSPRSNSKLLPNSSNSLRANNENFSRRLNGQQTTLTLVEQRKNAKGVSRRTVVGMSYVTCNKSGVEYSEQQVAENTDNCCSHCDQSIENLNQISEFFGKKSFVCTDCTREVISVSDIAKEA